MKLVRVVIITILMSTVLSLFNNESKAATYLIDEAQLYSKSELISFYYKGVAIGVEFVVYKKDGVEYPAYCLNRTLPGVTTSNGAKVEVNQALSNMAVWRAITNGYPFKTPKELNCNSDLEAFAATKMAVYDALYTYNWNDFEYMNGMGKRILEAAENISKKARNSKDTKPVGKVEIKMLTDEWKIDEKEKGFISKTYKVETNVESTKYSIKLDGITVDNVKITDVDNKERLEFKSGEMFKILIPISELDRRPTTKTEFSIIATADLKTKPILYGETEDSNFQNYALVAGEWEFENTKIKDKYLSNTTKIKIEKKDKESNEYLENAKFNILDENKNVVYADVATNRNGTVQIEGILPGKYYIEEVEAPNGYTKYDELIEIDVSFNETYTINVDNYKKPEREDKEVDKKSEITVTGKKEILLPRTGF